MKCFSWLTRTAAAAVACGVMSACNPSSDPAVDSTAAGSTVQIGALDYRFDPAELTASPGQSMRVELVNKGHEPTQH